jgi:O-acetyl-ADP-ribose deacetylase (regulator of RNase III)
MRTFPLPPLTIEVLEGDISTRQVDAVVNAANNALWMGSGVAGALKARGGDEIERAAMAQGPIQPGRSVLTTGGRLPAGHVIHAAVMGQDLRTDAQLIEQTTRSALALASAQNFRSIAFPALGTGVGGFPVAECARLMVGALRGQAATTSLRRVEFVLFGSQAYADFVKGVEAALEPSENA